MYTYILYKCPCKYHVHGEACLTSTVFNSYHRGSVSHFEEETELTEEDEHDKATKLCDCEDLRPAICVAHA